MNAIIPPISLIGPVITIRKFSREALTMQHLVQFGSITPDVADFLSLCVQGCLNILVSGGTAFAVDALVLELLTALLGVHPIAARLVAISLAMVAGWRMHRTLTFAVSTRPSVAEFLRYAGVAWAAAALAWSAVA